MKWGTPLIILELAVDSHQDTNVKRRQLLNEALVISELKQIGGQIMINAGIRKIVRKLSVLKAAANFVSASGPTHRTS